MTAASTSPSPSSAPAAGDNNRADDFLVYFNQAITQKDVVAVEQAALRKIYKDAEKAGHNVRALKKAMADSQISGSQREADDRDYREMMAWLKKPVGLGPNPSGLSQPSDVAMSEHERQECDRSGYAVGKMGGRQDSNPWLPGSLHFASFDGGWRRGAEELEARSAAGTAPKRGPGRPPTAATAARRTPNGAGASP